MKDEMEVLLVDDERSLLDQAKIFLEKEEPKLNVSTASSAKNGLESLDKEDFDVIVSDYKMPEMDGLEFLKEVKKNREMDIPFIVFTGKGREEVAMKALNLGADRYLRKGGDPRSQYGVLAQAIKQEREHKETKKRLQKTYRRFKAIFNDPTTFLGILDKDGTLLSANQASLEFIGADEKEVEGKKFWNTPWWDHSEQLQNRLKEAVKKTSSGDYDQFEAYHVGEKGEDIFVDFHIRPVKDKDGEIISLIVEGNEITKRKEMEDELKRKEVYLEHTPEFIVALDEEGEIKYWSPSPSDLGFDSLELDDLVENNVFDFIHPKDRETTIDIFNKAVEKPGEVFSAEIRGKAEEDWIWFEVRAISLLEDPEVESVIVTGREIQKRKENQKKLEAERKKRKTLLDNIPGYALILEKDSREIVFSNEKAREVGAVPGERCYEKIAERDDPCPFCKMLEIWETEEQREIEVEYEGRYYYGIWRPYTEDLYVHYIFDITERKEADRRVRKTKEKLERLQQASADLETCESKEEIYAKAIEVAEDILEFDWCVINTPEKDRLVKKKASKNYPDEESSYLLIDDSVAGKAFLENGSFLTPRIDEVEKASPTMDDYRSGITVPIGKFGVFQAISSAEDDFDEDDLIMAELLIVHVNEALNRIESKKTEEFLNSMLRHELKNKSSIVQGYLQLIEEHDLDEEMESLIEKAIEANKVERETIEKIRKLREIQDAVKERADLVQVIEDVIGVKKEIVEDFELELETDLPSLEIQAGPFLEELVENLVDNSIRHSHGSLVKISIEEKENEVLCRVEDDGKGIPDEMKDKIFERGFKKGDNAGSGSGLGLFLVKEIVESYGGIIEVKDSDLGGARLDIKLNRT